MSSNETALEDSQAPEHSSTPALAIASPTVEPALDEIVEQAHSFISEEEEPIEVDISPNLETDSAFGEGDIDSSYTTSLTSSIFDYQYENGRRYHAFRAGQYLIPNDEKEQNRMDMWHHVCSMILGGELYLAPIGKNPQRVLDIGTGTGIWAIDFADQYPSAEVIGIDLSCIQPSWIPPNVRFQIDDVEFDWTFPITQPFDFIHIRCMGGSIADWPRLLRQSYDHLAPGGWIQLIDGTWATSDDDSFPERSSYAEFQRRLDEASVIFGRRINVGPMHKRTMIESGFEGVVEVVKKVPLSPWPRDPRLKEIGMYMQVENMEAVESYGLAFLTRVLGWEATRTQVLIAGVRQDLRNRNFHLYSNCLRSQATCLIGNNSVKIEAVDWGKRTPDPIY